MGADTVPLFTTDEPISDTLPSRAMIAPLLITLPSLVPPKACVLPAMKSLSARSRVEAKKLPPVTTLPLGPTTIPAGSIRYTLPVDSSLPSIRDSAVPVTRFSVAPEPFRIVTF